MSKAYDRDLCRQHDILKIYSKEKEYIELLFIAHHNLDRVNKTEKQLHENPQHILELQAQVKVQDDIISDLEGW
jgi:hypothetical protein